MPGTTIGGTCRLRRSRHHGDGDQHRLPRERPGRLRARIGGQPSPLPHRGPFRAAGRDGDPPFCQGSLVNSGLHAYRKKIPDAPRNTRWAVRRHGVRAPGHRRSQDCVGTGKQVRVPRHVNRTGHRRTTIKTTTGPIAAPRRAPSTAVRHCLCTPAPRCGRPGHGRRNRRVDRHGLHAEHRTVPDPCRRRRADHGLGCGIVRAHSHQCRAHGGSGPVRLSPAVARAWERPSFWVICRRVLCEDQAQEVPHDDKFVGWLTHAVGLALGTNGGISDPGPGGGGAPSPPPPAAILTSHECHTRAGALGGGGARPRSGGTHPGGRTPGDPAMRARRARRPALRSGRRVLDQRQPVLDQAPDGGTRPARRGSAPWRTAVDPVRRGRADAGRTGDRVRRRRAA